MIDHRDSPGIGAEQAAKMPGALVAPGGAVLERDIKHCAHCQRGVVLNPGRVRARAVCPKCYAYICDGCESVRVASGGACVPFKQVMDVASELAHRAPDVGVSLDTLMRRERPLSVAVVNTPAGANTEVGR